MKFKDYRPYYKRNIKVAIPVMITQAGQYVVQFADNVMVGHLGTSELAGVAFANSILIMGMVFSMGFTQGVTPHIGQYYGENKFSMAAEYFSHSLRMSFLLAIGVCIVMSIPLIFMDYMGQDPEVVFYSKQYYRILLVSLFPAILFFSIRQFSEGIGITKYAMYITLICNALNILLNWILIYGKFGMPAMGVQGAAIATLISRVMSLVLFALLIIKIYPYKHYLKFFSRTRMKSSIVKPILSTSIPLSLQNLIEIAAFSLSAIMVGWLGKHALASHQIAMSMSSMSFMVAIGFGAAATIRVSHQYGEKNYIGTKYAGIASVHLSIGFMGCFGILFVLLRKYIPMIFTSDPVVIEIASGLLVMVAIYQVFDALQLASLASLRALKDVKIPLIFSAISYFLICLPMGYIFGFVFNFGARGVWVGLELGLLFAGILFFTRFLKIINRTIKEKGEGNAS